MSEWNYVGAAYALTWLVFAGYSLVLARKVRGARRRVEAMARYPEVGQ
jgi:CcmD family protein